MAKSTVKNQDFVFAFLSIILLIFYVYSAAIKPAASQYHRGIYVLITYIMVLIIYPSKQKMLRVVDYILIAVAIFTCGYYMLDYENLMHRAGIETLWDKIVSVLGVILGIEIARRVIGGFFVIIGAVFLVYGVFGPYFPEPFTHPGNTIVKMCTLIFLKDDGVFGIVADVIATYILLFVMFGAFLEKSGAYGFFIDFPIAAFGHKLGGPAKVSVLSSALFGSISGSAIANTVATGSFTIPMMKQAGFRPHVAGGIEPAASIGGMFMPPIMGAGAFIMSEITGIPYAQIMLISIFPALMYFFSVYIMIHYEAKIHNIKGIKSTTSAIHILRKEGYFVIPLFVIITVMLLGFSPGMAAVIGLISCIVISLPREQTRMGPRKIIEAAISGSEE